MTEYWHYVVYYLVASASFIMGWKLGKASRNIKLEGLGAQEAFAYFLLHEIHRHRQDIAAAKQDLSKLAKAGFKPPDIPIGLWIEVKKGGK
jgi:hypothetical protein